jgi:TPR repeat protein
MLASVLLASPALAFDVPSAGAPAPVAAPAPNAGEAFREATRAYYAGDTATALDAFRDAAELGHPTAQWKLGRMYAEGDGVAEDDYTAFQYFSRVVTEHADDLPGSAEAPFVANAFVEIGGYYLTGISNAGIEPNASRAREIFTYAASYFGDAAAQYQLGRMYLDGVGVEQDPRQAARWFMLAARKGQVEAQAELGRLLASGEGLAVDRAQGLMWLTVALRRAQEFGVDDSHIRAAHESAFALADENERRSALIGAEQWLADNTGATAAAYAAE